jgi:hypothetical protein
VFAPGTDISTYEAISTAYTNGSYQAVGAALTAGNSFTLYTWTGTAQGGNFTGSGSCPVLLLNTAGSLTGGSNPMYSKATVSFSGGSGTLSYSSFTAVVSGTGSFTVSQVTVSPDAVSVVKGGAWQFTAAVTGTNNPPQTVTWSVSGNDDSGTAINADGLLTVAAGESAAAITVRAASTAAASISGTAAVTVTAPPSTVTSVTVSPDTVSVTKGNTRQFTAQVTGTNNPAQTVTWSVSGNDDNGTAINADGLLTVAAGESAAAITVRAMSTLDISRYGEATVTLEDPVGGAAITINFEGPVEDLSIPPPAYAPDIPVLENGVWRDDNDAIKYFQFYAQAGSTYSINWNDSEDGTGKTLNIRVAADWQSGGTIFSLTNNGGYYTPQTFTADRSGIVLLKVTNYYETHGTGSYAVKYTATETTLNFAVANAAGYTNFQWLLDGTVLTGETAGSIRIDTSILAPGTHRITVIAVKAGQSYSREVSFPING